MRGIHIGFVAGLLCVAALALPAGSLAAGVAAPQFLGKWGGMGSSAGQLNNPSGIAATATPSVYVLDSANNRVDRFGLTGDFEIAFGKDVGDAITGGADRCFAGCKAGTAGTAAGQLNSLSEGVAATASNVWVTDESNSRLERWDENGLDPQVIGGLGTGADQMDHPSGVAVDASGNNVYVVDQGNRRIDQYDGSGNFVRAWGFGVDDGTNVLQTCTVATTCQAGSAGGAGNGQLNVPVDVAVDADGNVYVTDPQNGRVTKYDSAGAFITKWDSSTPIGIAVDRSTTPNAVYVVERSNNRVAKYDTSGNFQLAFGWGVADGSADYQVCLGGCQAGIAGAGDGQFDLPNRVAVDPGGNVYVSDNGNNRIEKFGVRHVVANHASGALAAAVSARGPYDTLFLTPGAYPLATQLDLTKPVNLLPEPGSGANARTVTIRAPAAGRAIEVHDGVGANIEGVTVTGGSSHSSGGGIRIDRMASVHLTNSTVRGNQTVYNGSATVAGGGIFNAGTLFALNVTVSGNASRGGSSADGSGIGRGGGVATAQQASGVPTSIIVNSTVSGNAATIPSGATSNRIAGGGGLATDAHGFTATFTSTIAGNSVTGLSPSAASGGGGDVWDANTNPNSGATIFSNTIVAAGSSPAPGTENCAKAAAALMTWGNNLEDRNQCGLTNATDQRATPVLLGALQDNGGPTDTRAIQRGGPAQDHARNLLCPIYDERGRARKTAGNPKCDLGAFELQPGEAGAQPKRPPKRPPVPTPTPKAACRLKALGSRVVVPKPATLRLRVTCDRSAAVVLRGKITAKPRKRKGHRAKRVTIKLRAVRRPVLAGKRRILKVKVPKRARRLLAHRARESASFRLTATNAGGSSTARTRIARLKLKQRR